MFSVEELDGFGMFVVRDALGRMCGCYKTHQEACDAASVMGGEVLPSHVVEEMCERVEQSTLRSHLLEALHHLERAEQLAVGSKVDLAALFRVALG